MITARVFLLLLCNAVFIVFICLCADNGESCPSQQYYIPVPHEEAKSNVTDIIVTTSDAFSAAVEGNKILSS